MDPDAVWDRELGRSRMGVLDGVVIVEFGASHCNQWGLCDAALPKLLRAGLVTRRRLTCGILEEVFDKT